MPVLQRIRFEIVKSTTERWKLRNAHIGEMGLDRQERVPVRVASGITCLRLKKQDPETGMRFLTSKGLVLRGTTQGASIPFVTVLYRCHIEAGRTTNKAYLLRVQIPPPDAMQTRSNERVASKYCGRTCGVYKGGPGNGGRTIERLSAHYPPQSSSVLKMSHSAPRATGQRASETPSPIKYTRAPAPTDQSSDEDDV
ncbi:hypothetical protein OE88DRAFT_1657813 [Heliocybe sulcata]|uniref:Uncharacterized protein n=1 Tax=Heliocybe sulcata TaxID=5364 RepID=A0A5C3N5G3_9AGAM|nr:hypothetical protein OE88DRAFT_1657813 [Heliocybe sulcata]